MKELKVKDDGFAELTKLLREGLKKFSAKYLTELEPIKNAHVAFKIVFIDPDIKPKRCMMRPLAHNLKDKVKRALAEQEVAGIIRTIFSEWASALRVVHKQDGSIRITVDYTQLNKVI